MSTRLHAWHLLVAVLFERRPRERRALATALAALETETWYEILSQANENLVTAAVAVRLRGLGPAAAPPDVLEYLESFHALNRARNEAIAAELEDCIATLNARGIEPMPLKGAAYLAARVHDDVGERFVGDLDLLVSRDAAHDAWEALRAHGYAPIGNERFDPARHRHLPALARGEDCAAVEIHVAAVEDAVERALPTSELWRESVRPASALRYRLPSPSDLVMTSFLHAEVMDKGVPFRFSPLRVFCDLDALDARYADVDWERNLHRAARIGAQHAFRRYLYTYCRFTGRRPLPALRSTASDAVHHALCAAAVASPLVLHWVLRAERLSARKLRERHGIAGGWLSLNLYRAKRAVSMLARACGVGRPSQAEKPDLPSSKVGI